MKVIKGIHYKTGQCLRVEVKNGMIQSIKEMKEPLERSLMIAPGLIDLQINGYMGIDFNNQPLTVEKWEKIVNSLLKVGVTAFYPTIITNCFNHLAELFEKNMQALQKRPSLFDSVKGFHLEGPYISKEDGPRGAHDEAFVRAPNWEEFCELQEKAKGMIKLLTLSPEWEGASEFIQKVSESGVLVAIGHTAASTKQISEAVKAGAKLSTHLGNGAHAMLPRHPNYLWDQLAEESLWASVIADGHHLPMNVLKVFEKVKKDQMILVSDSVALAGLPAGDYTTPVGGEVTLTNAGRLHLRDEPALLAGSAMTLFEGIQRLVTNHVLALDRAVEKASLYPAALMGLPQKIGLREGAPADLILFDQRKKPWRLHEVYQAGKRLIKK